MSIPLDLLKSTWGRALGVCVYGGAGTRKTFGIHTLPPPVLMDDFEGGAQSIMPWVRKTRRWDQDQWTVYSDADRQEAYDLLTQENKDYIATVTRVQPRPYVDVVWYDNMDAMAYQKWVTNLANFNFGVYSSYACDSLQEQTGAIKSMAKGKGLEMDIMATKLWAGVQDRSVAALRAMRNMRDKGVFIYTTCSENIDKDYVVDPRSVAQGDRPQEPYSVKGTVNVSGQVVAMVQHTCDIMMHTRNFGQVGPVWVSIPEPIGASGAMWEAKDRTGRIKEPRSRPNMRVILTDIYGEEKRKQIYASGTQSAASA